MLNNPLKFTDPSGYLSEYYRQKNIQNQYDGGYYYSRGEFYVWDKKRQNYTTYGNSFGTGPTGSAGAVSGYNWQTGEYQENGETVPYFIFFDQRGISGNMSGIAGAGAERKFAGSINWIQFGENYVKPIWEFVFWDDGEVVINPAFAANRGGEGHDRSILREMIQTTFLPMLVVDGTAHSVKDLSSVVKNVTKRTSRTLSLIQFGVDAAYLSKNGFTWGEKAYLGVSGLSMFMTWSKNPYILVPGIAGTFANEFGAFDSWYDDWNEAEADYKNGGVSVLPVNYPFGPVSVPIVVVNNKLFK